MTSTIERLATAEELGAITDPEARLKAAGETAERALADADAARLRRDAAAVEMLRVGVPAVRIWKDTLGVSRTLWGRILDLADPSRRREALPAKKAKRAEELAATIVALRAELADLDDAQLVERLRQYAAENAAAARDLDALSEAAAEVRNRTAYGLISREYGVLLSNAEVARMARLTTARVAQLRKSY